MTFFFTHIQRIGLLALAHLGIVAAALAVALALALPLGILAYRRASLRPWLVGVLGAIYTIPSLALLAIFVQIFGLGSLPIFVALVAYAQFMLVRNVVAGLAGVEPSTRDAARGIGFSPAQSLWRVELPLALPVLIGGIRIATIAMIAIATLGAYVGGGGLGTLIFDGLTLHNNGMILAGSIAASLLAIIADGGLRLLEKFARRAAGFV